MRTADSRCESVLTLGARRVRVRHSTCARSVLDVCVWHLACARTTLKRSRCCTSSRCSSSASRASFGDDAEIAAEALYRTQLETFAGASFGRGADAADGVAASHNLFDHMLGATAPALAMVLLAIACLVRLMTPFEAAMHWFEVTSVVRSIDLPI